MPFGMSAGVGGGGGVCEEPVDHAHDAPAGIAFAGVLVDDQMADGGGGGGVADAQQFDGASLKGVTEGGEAGVRVGASEPMAEGGEGQWELHAQVHGVPGGGGNGEDIGCSICGQLPVGGAEGLEVGGDAVVIFVEFPFGFGVIEGGVDLERKTGGVADLQLEHVGDGGKAAGRGEVHVQGVGGCPVPGDALTAEVR